MKRALICCFLMSAAMACRVKEDSFVASVKESKYEAVEFSTEVQGRYESCPAVRSILPEDVIENKVTQVTLASFDEYGRLIDTEYFTGNLSSMRLDIAPGGPSNVYALVNMGDMTGRIPDAESEMPGFTYSLGSYAGVEACGIPMSGMLAGVTPHNSLRVIPVDRLFAKVSIRILHTSMENSSSATPYAFNLRNISMYIRQANTSLSPFAKQGSKAEMPSDVTDFSDYCADMGNREDYKGSLPSSGLGPGPGYFQDTTFVFYVPENVQGALLQGNTDPLAKVEDGIKDIAGKDYSGLCTYVELNAKRENTGHGYSGSVMYRFYLGDDDVSDFSVTGNCSYDLTLDLTEDGLHLDSWKVTRGDDWTDTRVLSFLNDPYVVYRGGTCNVGVRYHRSSSVSGSENRPDDWIYVFDDAKMKTAGLSYVFDPDIYAGEDFTFTFTAAENARLGASFPLVVKTKDGRIVDEARLSIAAAGRLIPVWDHQPLYVSQYGNVKISGAGTGKLPLAAHVSDEEVVRLEQVAENEFRITAMAVGKSDIRFENSDGSQSVSLTVNVSAPVLDVADGVVSLNPDGASCGVAYRYLDKSGNELQYVDQEVFEADLFPDIVEDTFFAAASVVDCSSLYIKRLSYDGQSLVPGAEYDVYLGAIGCPEVVPQGVTVCVSDPFEGIVVSDYGDLDDYSLFASVGTDAKVRAYFSDKLSEGAEKEFAAPVPDCDQALVRASLKPSGPEAFTYSNEMYLLEYESVDVGGGALFRLKRNSLYGTLKHSAGRHDVLLSVVNRHSLESMDHVCGWIDVYLHAAIGARAEFGNAACSYRLGSSGKTFAETYNSIAGTTVYNSSSSNRIHYMDVGLEWLVDVSGARIFKELSTSVSSDALGLVTPGRADGYRDQNTRLLYSVCRAGDDRLGVGGEPVGPRAGIGRMLYRTLYMQTYGYELSEVNLKEWFLGFSSLSGHASSDYSPSWLLHDLNAKGGTDVVSSRSPFHYCPPSFDACVDLEVKGYYVIHFLEEIAPETGGWINLL